MLQKADQDRLDKVLSIIEALGIRFPVAELGGKMKVDKGMVSSYLAGKKPMSDKFYSNFIQTFDTKTGDNAKSDAVFNNVTTDHGTQVTNAQLAALIEGNKNQSIAVKDIAATALKLAAMLEESKHSDIPQDTSPVLLPYLQVLASALGDKFGLSAAQLLEEMGNILASAHLGKKVSGTLSGASK